MGLRFDGKDEFFINVDQNNNQTKFKTTKDRFNFESATGTYSFNTPDFNSNLNIKADTDFIGVTTSISNDAGLYGIRHTSNRTVSLVNSNGELRLGTNGDGVFIKGADTVTITPGGTSAGSSAGTINATASNSNKVKLNTFGNSNNRPIACFGARVDTEDPLTSTDVGLSTPANRGISPTVSGTDGKFTATYIATTDTSKASTFVQGVKLGTAATSTLSDYEEGTFTPEFNNEDGTVTYGTVQSGTYVKVGNHVTLHFEVDYSGATGTGGITITSPFKSTGASNCSFAAVGSATIYGAAGSTDLGKIVTCTIARNNTSVIIRAAEAVTGNPAATVIKYNNTPEGRIKATITYRTA